MVECIEHRLCWSWPVQAEINVYRRQFRLLTRLSGAKDVLPPPLPCWTTVRSCISNSYPHYGDGRVECTPKTHQGQIMSLRILFYKFCLLPSHYCLLPSHFCLLSSHYDLLIDLSGEDELYGSFDIPTRSSQCSDVFRRIP